MRTAGRDTLLHAAWVLYFVSLAFYAVSFLLPAFEIVVEGQHDASYGYDAFLVALAAAWQPMLGGLLSFVVWLANPAYWAGAVFFGRGRYWRSAAASIAAVVLGCHFVFAPLILVGYFVWLGSMALLALASSVRLVRERQARIAERVAPQPTAVALLVWRSSLSIRAAAAAELG
jgi:hypothetical protein